MYYIETAARDDRFAWFSQFYANWNTATAAAPMSAYAVVPTWIDDFSADVEALRDSGRPTLIVHGTADRILPIDATGRPVHAALPDAEYHEIDGAPHGMLWTHAEDVNASLVPVVQQ